MSFGFGNLLSDMSDEVVQVDNLIDYFIPEDKMKALMYTCLRVDIPDNNDKAKIVSLILGPEFIEIGTGTNRIAYKHNGVVVKVALDRRGLVDNLTEFKRSSELEVWLARTYESNYLVNICEYVEVLDQDEFYINEGSIKEILQNISQNYLFDDIGFTEKNSYNWGKREAILTDDERRLYGSMADDIYDVVILDYGYLYPLHGQKKELFRCPKCHHELKWNGNFTMLGCTNSGCMLQITPMQLRHRMNLDMEDLENSLIAQFSEIKTPNLAKIEKEILKIGKTLEGSDSK